MCSIALNISGKKKVAVPSGARKRTRTVKIADAVISSTWSATRAASTRPCATT
jgi:hypothetical protein